MDPTKQATVDCYLPAGPAVSIIDEVQCRTGCSDTVCVTLCPAGIFVAKDGTVAVDRGGVCLECGACRLVCENVAFDYPPAGSGVIHRFG